MHEDEINPASVAALYTDLESDAAATLKADGIDPERMRIVREADVRYSGQSTEVKVTAPAGTVNGSFLDGLVQGFHAAHLRTFGYNYAGQQKVELVNFCVSGFGLIDRPQLPRIAQQGDAVPARRSVRPVYFDGAFCDTPVYDRAGLRAHARLRGPAIIEEFGSTTVVFPQQELTVDAHGILVIRPCAGTPSRVPQ
jgi:N-methylhydantoinase A